MSMAVESCRRCWARGHWDALASQEGHAERVAHAGTWLNLADLILAAEMNDKDSQSSMFKYDAGLERLLCCHCQDLRILADGLHGIMYEDHKNLFQRHFPGQRIKDRSGREPWAIVLCNCAYEPASDWDHNHWVPAWSLTSLDLAVREQAHGM